MKNSLFDQNKHKIIQETIESLFFLRKIVEYSPLEFMNIQNEKVCGGYKSGFN